MNKERAYVIYEPKIDRREVDGKEFIDYYSKRYFLNGPSILGVSQSSEWIESEIEKLLKNKQWSEPDVVHILAWKMGRIDHKKSQEKRKFVFLGHNSWSDEPPFKATNRSGKIEIEDLADKILEFQEDYHCNKEQYDNNPESLFERLAELGSIKGIGPVYLITILFFVSGGEYPIYDQFAMMALKAIDNKSVKLKDLPNKDTRAFKTLLNNDSVYSDYIRRLKRLSKDIYGNKEAYKNNRSIDQALWVYGHLVSLVDNK